MSENISVVLIVVKLECDVCCCCFQLCNHQYVVRNSMFGEFRIFCAVDRV